MTYVKNTSLHKLKNQQKTPVVKDKGSVNKERVINK